MLAQNEGNRACQTATIVKRERKTTQELMHAPKARPIYMAQSDGRSIFPTREAKRTGTPWMRSAWKGWQCSRLTRKKGAESDVQRTHNNAIALLSSGERGALCLIPRCPFPSAKPGCARRRSSSARRFISTSSASTPPTKLSASASSRPYSGRTVRGVRGVIWTLSSEVEIPGERRGCLGRGMSYVAF